MPNIKLPDGNMLAFDKKVTGLKIAEKISKSLSKQALVNKCWWKFKGLKFWNRKWLLCKNLYF